MASKKIKDIAVKTGTYNVNGETKSRYENVGALFRSDDGSEYIMLKRTFNPAGVDVEPGRDSVILGIFELRDQQTPQQKPPTRQGGTAQGPSSVMQNGDEDIPF